MSVEFPALEQKRAELRRLLEEAGPDHDMTQIKSISGTAGEKAAHLANLNLEIEQLKATQQAATAARNGGGLERGAGDLSGTVKATSGSAAAQWAVKAADSMAAAAKKLGVKALTSGSIDIPALIRTDVVSMPERPDRLIDLLINRENISGNEYEFLHQTLRQNNAAPVADHAQKPESVFTVTPVEGRARVIAHLSEPLPERFFADHKSLIRWLEGEMYMGVVDALEAQIINGSGIGENMTGVNNTAGITVVPFATDTLTTLRKARTALQIKRETPTGWVFNPADAEGLDLLREGTSGMFLSAGPGLSNILGNIPVTISTSITAGTALLGDWRQVRLFVREGTRLDADRSGQLFKNNEVVLRAEGRFGIGVLRPQAIATVDLVA